MNPDLFLLFDRMPGTLPLYEAAQAKILAAFPDSRIKVGKTQVSFSNRYGYAYLWPPRGRVKSCPEVGLGLTFGLGYRLEHPRIFEAVEPYPNRWTHHMLIGGIEELDGEVMAWLREAYEFSLHKGRGRA